MITLVVNAARVPVRRSPELLDQSPGRGPSGMYASCCSQKKQSIEKKLQDGKMVIWEYVRGYLGVTWDYVAATNANFEYFVYIRYQG